MKITKQKLKEMIKKELESYLLEEGISRRDFLKGLGKTAAGLGAASLASSIPSSAMADPSPVPEDDLQQDRIDDKALDALGDQVAERLKEIYAGKLKFKFGPRIYMEKLDSENYSATVRVLFTPRKK